MEDGSADDKFVVEDWLEKVADVEPEDFLPPIADVVVSEILGEDERKERHQAWDHRANIQQSVADSLLSNFETITGVADHQESVEDYQNWDNPEKHIR